MSSSRKTRTLSANPTPRTANKSKGAPTTPPSKPSETDLEKELKQCRAEVICLRAKFNPAEIEKNKIQTVTTEQMFQDALLNVERDLKKYEEGVSDNPMVKELKDKLYKRDKEVASLKKASKQEAEEITVLKRRCNSLETDYTKIKSQYDSVVNKLPSKDDFRVLENDYRLQIDALKRELAQTKEKLKLYTQKLPDILSKRHGAETLQKELDDTKKDRDTVRHQFTNIKKELSTKEKELSDYMEERKRLKEGLTKHTSQIEDLNSTNATLTNTIAQLKRDLSAAQYNDIKDASATKTQVSKLENELKSAEREADQFRKRVKDLEQELKQAKDENKRALDSKKLLESEVNKLRQENESLSKDVAQQSGLLHERDKEIDQLQVKLTEAGENVYRSVDGRISESERDSELNRLQKECESLTMLLASVSKTHATKQSETLEIRKLNNDIKEMEKRHTRKSKELEVKLQDEKGAHTRTKQEKDKLEMKCHDAFEKISQKEKKLEQQETIHKKLIERKDSTIKELRREKTIIDPTPNSKPDLKTLETNNKKMFDELEDVKRENEELRMRLSKTSSSQLLEGNTDFVDLSDTHRPDLLVETFSQLYDNEWTDAFESCEIERGSVKDAADTLFKALLSAYNFCQEQRQVFMKRILASFQIVSNGTDRIDLSQLPPKRSQTLRELLKRFAADLAQKVSEEYVKKYTPIVARKDVSDKYVQRCVSVLWLMCVQNPPLALDTGRPSGTFDDSVYRHFTKGGDIIDFVVWPPVRIQENGRLICKGIAQGK